MAHFVQILCQATCAPAQKDSNSEVVEQSVMVIFFSSFHFVVSFEGKLLLLREMFL